MLEGLSFVGNPSQYMRYPILILISFLLSAHATEAQHWANVKKDRSSNFNEKKAAFEAYWGDREYEKGKGFKQFKRYEWYWDQRLDDSGEFPDPKFIWEEYERYTDGRKAKGADQMKVNANWSPIGGAELQFHWSGPGVGRTSCVAEDPSNNDILYVGTPGGGLWKSFDSGSSWNPMTDDLPTLGVSGVVVDPVDTDIVYIATGDGDGEDTYSVGVLKSYDGGNTWEATNLAWQIDNMRVCHKLMMSPYDNHTLFVSTNVGLWRSDNAGADWYSVQAGEIEDFEFHPTDPDVMYACGNLVYRSINGGQSFSNIHSDLPASSAISGMRIAVSPDEPEWLYVLAGRESTQGFLGLYRSIDGGESFTQRSNSPNVLGWSGDGSDAGGQAWYDLALGVDPNNADRVFVGGVNLWRSTNGGSSWSIRAHWVYPSFTGTYVHADIHQLEYINGRFYCLSDGGIWRSTNNGVTFTDISDGIRNTQFYRLGVSQSNENMVLGGSQDNGSHRMLNGEWGQVYGGDGMECVVHPTNSNIYYVSTQNGGIRRTTNGGNNFDYFVGGIGTEGAWVTPYMLDPNDPNIVYAGFQNLWKRVGNGAWQTVSPSSGNITDFDIAPGNSDVIYTARYSLLKRTTDGGDNWDNMNIGMSGSNDITDVTIDPDDENTVYVTISGFNETQKIFRTTDGGENWENITGNLPNFPCNTVACEAGSNGGVYVGMDVGVYYTNDDLAGWMPYDEGLPRVAVSELEFHTASGTLRAATYGRGMWESPVFSGIDQLPIADFYAESPVICVGDSVSFFDESLYNETGWEWEFEGGAPATSTDATPVITYDNEGSYTATLTVSNELGEDEEVKTAYVSVLSPVGEQPPFTEGFEDMSSLQESGRWFINNEDGDPITWELNESVGYNSSSCVWVNNFSNTFDNRDRLYSTTIDMSEMEEVNLRMDVAFAQKDEDDKDKLRVYVSANCGGNYSLKKTFSGHTTLKSVEPQSEPFFPSSDADWHELVVPNIGEQFFVEGFRMQFYFENDGGNNLFMDNINLYSLTTDLSDLERNNLKLSLRPNPTEDVSELGFFLLGDRHVRLQVLDMAGRAVLSEDLGELPFGDQRLQLDASAWAPGIYTISLDVDGLVQQVKWAVR